MPDPLITVEKLGKSFGRKKILSSVSFEVKPGEIIGLIGASGSGKTTLLNMMIGFISPDTGDVKYKEPQMIADKPIYNSVFKQQKKFKNIYGFAAQLPSFYEKLTVKENLYYFGELYGLSREVLRSNVDSLLKLIDLETASNQLGKNLSGGMERRLDIACALIHNPQVLIMDEPTSDLDPLLRRSIWALIKQINNKGTTVIISSHHLNELETLCDRIAIIKDGTLLDIATPSELKTRYLKHHEIRIESHPGNYKELEKNLSKKFSKEIIRTEQRGGELVLFCEDHKNLLNQLVKEIEKNNEKIIELKLVKPSLNQVFINLNIQRE
ncbi:ABC transporter ATP-binding protein [Candidatus Woesearchaeota archaeon]|nr:ABC transporter ATP-binding protein [Candidatus Woesearchaeota archaeon]